MRFASGHSGAGVSGGLDGLGSLWRVAGLVRQPELGGPVSGFLGLPSLHAQQTVEILQRVLGGVELLDLRGETVGCIDAPDECLQQLLKCGGGEKVCCLAVNNRGPDAPLVVGQVRWCSRAAINGWCYYLLRC